MSDCGHQACEEMEVREKAMWKELRELHVSEIRNAETDEKALDILLGIVGAWEHPMSCSWAVEAFKKRMGMKIDN